MTDTSGAPVPTTPPPPKGPVAFIDAMKARSGGKEPTGGVIDMTKPLDVNALKAHFGPNSKLNPEQQTQLAADLTTKLKNENPQYYEGFQDMQAGRKDTPAAQAYQQRLGQAQDEFVQQQVQADPQKASTPQGFGEIVNNAMSTFQGMHPAMQAMVGIGLPVGLIGVMSGLFGGGGMGAGILGALGLGAGLVGGAAGGLFGQGASNMAGDAMYNMGSFLGMVPEKADLSALKGNDPVGAIVNQSGRTGSREEVAKKLEAGQQQIGQLRQLMSLPIGDDAKIRLMQRLDPSIDSPEAGQQALRNAGTLLQAYDDPNSPLQTKMREGQEYANDKGTFRGWGKEQLVGWGDWLSGHGGLSAGQPQPGQVKGSSDMNINKLIEKWAFNDMDAKELSDLKAEQAKGAPYRVEDARREHELTMRNQAEPPKQTPVVKKQLVVMCMKSARCWAGYEPVPGKKPYSEDSCRPVGSGKKKKKDTKSKK